MKANYGFDAPSMMGALVLGGIATCIAATVGPHFDVNLSGLYFPGLSWFLTGCWMAFGSKVTKLKVRDRYLDALNLKGDEAVLDVGCGRGLMLIGAAKRVPQGKAVGIDLWLSIDQSGNAPEVTKANARAEGVGEDRITLETGDMTKMPFPDASFDVVVSSWAIHNVPTAEGRAKACQEIVRVLKPGGRVAILDIFNARSYGEVFRQAGMTDVQVGFYSLLFFIPTTSVTATKIS